MEGGCESGEIAARAVQAEQGIAVAPWPRLGWTPVAA